MLHTTCPRVARALVAGQRRARFATAFGSFAQRTIDRRYCGLPPIYGPQWFSQAVRLAGGLPSSLCWSPLHA